MLFQATTRAFFTGWLATKKMETSKGSYKRYVNAVDKLFAHLGDRADQDIAYVDKKDLAALRDKTATELSPSTANTDLKILRIGFAQAVSDGLRIDHPGKAVAILKIRKDADAPERRPFTEYEINQVLAVAAGEWRGIIKAGVYTGQRLGDIASLRWTEVDLKQGLVSLSTGKTGRRVIIPIAPDLLVDLHDRHKHAEVGAVAVFPVASQVKVDADGESRRLSAQFHALLVKAGLTAARSTNKNSGRGHSVQRTVSPLTFHSLRHTATSWLKQAGVPESVVRDIIGHDSVIISRNYTHIDEASKRRAVEGMPSIGGVAPPTKT